MFKISFLRKAFYLALITVLFLTVLAPIYQASAQAGSSAWVNTGRLNLRTGPGVNYAIITSLLRNSIVTMIGRTSDAAWVQVVIPGGVQGWMRSRFLLTNTPVGNLPITFNNTPVPPPVPQPPPGSFIHVVQPGENLFRIGLRYGLRWDVIAAANGIFNPNAIYAGQRLIIPPGGTQPPPTGGPVVHVVQPGETLQIIAARYGTTWQAIAAANNLANANFIFPGQRLTIPSGAPPPAPPPQPRTYTVQRGDNLTAIAARFGTTVQAIMAANNIVNPNLIAPGQVLTIP
jgi:LysM repeat protein